MSFIQYLNENRREVKELSIEEAVEICKINCKKAVSAMKSDKFLYRGSLSNNTYSYINNGDSSRKSVDGKNYYTLILDHILKKRKLPLRSKSTICTTSIDKAEHYGHVHVVLPFDNSRYGVVNGSDIWHSRFSGYEVRLPELNNAFRHMQIRDDKFENIIADLVRFFENIDTTSFESFLSDKDVDILKNNYYFFNDQLKLIYDIATKYGKSKDGIYKFITEIYNKVGLSFTNDLYKSTFSKDDSIEIWFEGEYIMVKLDKIEEFKEMF